jgi:hypothetical protein
LLGIFLQHDALKTVEFIRVDRLDSSAATLGGEGKDVVEVGLSKEGILQANGLRRRAEVNEGTKPGVASVRCCARNADELFMVNFVAEEKVAALYFLAKITKARGTADPAIVSHRINTTGAGAKVLVKSPTAPGIDLEDPNPHGPSSRPMKLRRAP